MIGVCIFIVLAGLGQIIPILLKTIYVFNDRGVDGKIDKRFGMLGVFTIINILFVTAFFVYIFLPNQEQISRNITRLIMPKNWSAWDGIIDIVLSVFAFICIVEISIGEWIYLFKYEIPICSVKKSKSNATQVSILPSRINSNIDDLDGKMVEEEKFIQSIEFENQKNWTK